MKIESIHAIFKQIVIWLKMSKHNRMLEAILKNAKNIVLLNFRFKLMVHHQSKSSDFDAALRSKKVSDTKF